MYDLIGDIHGHAAPLRRLLQRLGYAPVAGVWQHPERKAVFVGDFIDRGPAIREVLELVKGMTDQGHALAVMGNHEFNALAYAHALGGGRYLRSHNPMHTRQHQATLDQFKDDPAAWQGWLDWFYTLPLYLDLGALRVVHACWDQRHIDWLETHYQGRLTEHLLVAAHTEGSYPWAVIEETLKGKEFDIPQAYAWSDKDGHQRRSNRIKWWIDPSHSVYGDYLFNCPPALYPQPAKHHLAVPQKAYVYPHSTPPDFFGHYWMEDAFPVIQSHNVICLDYSVAKGGCLVAYRFEGEEEMRNEAFVWEGAEG